MEDVPIERCFVGDTETGGLGSYKRACQIGLIEFDPRTFEPIWEFQSLIDPEITMDPKAIAIHGITDEMVAGEPTFAEMVEHRLDGGLVGSITMVCHNVSFDEDLLLPLGHIARTLCTLEEARHWMPKGGRITPGPVSHKLKDLAAYLGIPQPNAHDALADCRTTLALLRHLVRISGRTFEQLASVKKRTVLVWPWGMYARQLLSAAPTAYIKHVLGFDNLEVNLRESLEKELVLR